MLARVISGLVLAIGIIAILFATPWWGLAAVVALALVISCFEYARMANADGDLSYGLIFTIACALPGLYPLGAKMWPELTHGAAFSLGFIMICLFELARLRTVDEALRDLTRSAFGLLYIGATCPFMILLRDRPGGEWVLLLTMAVTFLSDTGGYFAGRFFGRHKLYEAVSPKKTIEGALGGMAFSITGAFLAKNFAPHFSSLSSVDCLLLGGVGAGFAILGDLVESLIKRGFGVKDSGALIPGHGGLLDRIDGLLFCGPFVWFYLEVIGL